MPKRYISLRDLSGGRAAGQVWLRCPACGEISATADLEAQAMTCPWCDFHLPLEAHLRLERLVDPGSFQPAEEGLGSPSRFGRATLLGQPLALAVSDPNAAWTAAETRALASAVEGAVRERLPLLWVVTAPQGAATQAPWTGLPAVLGRLGEAGLPWLALVAGPCFGAPAALALQADLVLAEPGAAVAPVLPPALRQAGRWPLESARPARDLLRSGWCDTVVPRHKQRAVLADLLDLLGFPGQGAARSGAPPSSELFPIPCLNGLAAAFYELHGDRQSTDDAALVGGLARLSPTGMRALLLATAPGQNPTETRRRHAGLLCAAGWRKATRLLLLAGRFGLPVVTVLDRAGLRIGQREQAAAVAWAFGETLRAMLTLPVPTVSVCLQADEGPAGLVLAATDYLLAREEAVPALRQSEITPDATFAADTLPGALTHVLEELTQTYAGRGPLGRRKLLQRRLARQLRPRPTREVNP